MKHYLIPYLIGKEGAWWSGIDFYNHADTKTAITVKIQRPNGTIKKIVNHEIEPLHHYIMDSNELDIGRATILIDCSDDVYVSAFMGQGDGYGMVPVHEVLDLKK